MRILTTEEVKKIFHYAIIDEGARIDSKAEIYQRAAIESGSTIYSKAIIQEGAVIRQGAVIHEGAIIKKGARIQEGARIGRERKNVAHNIVINGIGETKNITAYVCDDGLIINIGCVNDYRGLPYKEMKEQIAKKYHKDHEYFIALKLIKKWYKNLKK